MKKLISLSLLLISISANGASVIYEYNGPSFDTFFGPNNNDNSNTYGLTGISGYIELTSLLTPNTFNEGRPLTTSYSFTDGRTTFTESNSSFVDRYYLVTDSEGSITEWSVFIDTNTAVFNELHTLQTAFDLTNPSPHDQASYCAGNDCTHRAGGDVVTLSNPGLWTVVPIPPAAYLFLTGLAALGWISCRSSQLEH